MPCPSTIHGSSKLGTEHRAARSRQCGRDRLAVLGRAIIADDLGAQARASPAILAAGASVGITIAAGIPSRFAAQATPCA